MGGILSFGICPWGGFATPFRQFYEIFERTENFCETRGFTHGFPQAVENVVENSKKRGSDGKCEMNIHIDFGSFVR